jgi:hypothetical protein
MPLTLSANAQIPDAEVNNTLDGVCYLNGYTDTVNDGNGNQVPNPQTKGQFAQAWIDDKLRTSLINHNQAWKRNIYALIVIINTNKK